MQRCPKEEQNPEGRGDTKLRERQCRSTKHKLLHARAQQQEQDGWYLCAG